MEDRQSLRSKFETLALLKKVGIYRSNSKPSKIEDLVLLIELQGAIMCEISRRRGENIIELHKLRGEIDE